MMTSSKTTQHGVNNPPGFPIFTPLLMKEVYICSFQSNHVGSKVLLLIDIGILEH